MYAEKDQEYIYLVESHSNYVDLEMEKITVYTT